MRIVSIALALSGLLCAQVRLTPKSPPAPATHERAPETKVSTTHARTSAGKKAARPDAEIEKDFRARLGRSKLSKGNIAIRVQGGVATLTGNVDIVQHKGTATRMAKSAGAASVVNKIAISDQGKARAAANLERGRRRAQQARSEVASRR